MREVVITVLVPESGPDGRVSLRLKPELVRLPLGRTDRQPFDERMRRRYLAR